MACTRFLLLYARRQACGLALVLILAMPALATADVETYRIDPVHSQVWFSVSHDGFSFPQGRLRIDSGWFQFDEDDWSASRVDVTIDLDSVDLGDQNWNEAVRSGQFLGTSRWKQARYVSRSVEKTDPSHGVIHGDLTLRGQTHPLDVTFTLNRIGYDPYSFHRKAGFSAQSSLQRSGYGMTRYADVVGDLVRFHIEIEGVRDRAAAKPAVAQDAQKDQQDGSEE